MFLENPSTNGTLMKIAGIVNCPTPIIASTSGLEVVVCRIFCKKVTYVTNAANPANMRVDEDTDGLGVKEVNDHYRQLESSA